MRYWDEFSNKYGFGDGEDTPPDAKIVQKICITILNTVAEKLGSKFRVVAIDCFTHNPTRIAYFPVDKLNQWGWDDYTLDKSEDPVLAPVIQADPEFLIDFDPDEAMIDALYQLESNEDFYENFYAAYTVEVKLNEEKLREWVDSLK